MEQHLKILEGRVFGKHTRVNSMLMSPVHANKLLDVIHSDCCDPMITVLCLKWMLDLPNLSFYQTYNGKSSR